MLSYEFMDFLRHEMQCVLSSHIELLRTRIVVLQDVLGKNNQLAHLSADEVAACAPLHQGMAELSRRVDELTQSFWQYLTHIDTIKAQHASPSNLTPALILPEGYPLPPDSDIMRCDARFRSIEKWCLSLCAAHQSALEAERHAPYSHMSAGYVNGITIEYINADKDPYAPDDEANVLIQRTIELPHAYSHLSASHREQAIDQAAHTVAGTDVRIGNYLHQLTQCYQGWGEDIATIAQLNRVEKAVLTVQITRVYEYPF